MKSIQLIVLIIFQFNFSYLKEICDCGEPNTFRQKRIVGGNVLATNKYPWIVAIFDINRNNQFICGGTIVTKQHVLTAGHCVFKRNPKDIAVKIGSIRLDQSKHFHYISEIKYHFKYSEELQDFDIAVITLKNVLNDTSNRPICLPQLFDTNKNYKARIAGWGKTGFYSNEYFDEIRETEVTVGTNKECGNILTEEGIQLTDRILCAGDLLGKHDACQGDSGVPLMRVEPKSGKYYAIGLSSFGIGCAKIGRYGIYTKVDHFIDWIITTIGISNMTCQHIITTK